MPGLEESMQEPARVKEIDITCVWVYKTDVWTYIYIYINMCVFAYTCGIFNAACVHVYVCI